jgi:hypothetical protein
MVQKREGDDITWGIELQTSRWPEERAAASKKQPLCEAAVAVWGADDGKAADIEEDGMEQGHQASARTSAEVVGSRAIRAHSAVCWLNCHN